MATPYIVLADVTNYLDSPVLTTTQQAVAQTLINAAIDYANRVTLQAWNLDPITAEVYWPATPILLLRSRPITSVQQIQTRSTIVGDTLQPLVAGSDYEVLDPQRGMIVLDWGYGIHRQNMMLVDYTPNRPVPADVVRAVTLIAAHSLYPVLNPDRWGIEQAQVAMDKKIAYHEFGVELSVPEIAERILHGYRRPIWG